jgi:hypothetical protein
MPLHNSFFSFLDGGFLPKAATSHEIFSPAMHFADLISAA